MFGLVFKNLTYDPVILSIYQATEFQANAGVYYDIFQDIFFLKEKW